jgi:hypothetical protein
MYEAADERVLYFIRGIRRKGIVTKSLFFLVLHHHCIVSCIGGFIIFLTEE